MRKAVFERRCEEMRQRYRSATSGSPSAPVPTLPPLTVAEAAERLHMSSDWTRRYFGKVPGVLVIPSPTRLQKRRYAKLLIPVEVFEREWRRFEVAS
jgi:AraC-like DNA-binding protein